MNRSLPSLNVFSLSLATRTKGARSSKRNPFQGVDAIALGWDDIADAGSVREVTRTEAGDELGFDVVLAPAEPACPARASTVGDGMETTPDPARDDAPVAPVPCGRTSRTRLFVGFNLVLAVALVASGSGLLWANWKLGTRQVVAIDQNAHE